MRPIVCLVALLLCACASTPSPEPQPEGAKPAPEIEAPPPEATELSWSGGGTMKRSNAELPDVGIHASYLPGVTCPTFTVPVDGTLKIRASPVWLPIFYVESIAWQPLEGHAVVISRPGGAFFGKMLGLDGLIPVRWPEGRVPPPSADLVVVCRLYSPEGRKDESEDFVYDELSVTLKFNDR